MFVFQNNCQIFTVLISYSSSTSTIICVIKHLFNPIHHVILNMVIFFICLFLIASETTEGISEP